MVQNISLDLHIMRHLIIGIYNSKGFPLVSMIKIVPNYPLLFPYTNIDLPDGDFGCISDLGKIGRNDFVNSLADFVYIPRSDLE